MAQIFTVALPDIGEGVVEGEVVEWLKKVGDTVGKDEPVVVVMTDKATVELPSPCAGKLAQQHKKVGEIAVKDHPLYGIELAEEEKGQKIVPDTAPIKTTPEQPGEAEIQKDAEKVHKQPEAIPEVKQQEEPTKIETSKKTEKKEEKKQKSEKPCPLESFIKQKGAHALASPHTRELAKELHIDINQVPPTGVDGRVQEEDVVNFHSNYYQPKAKSHSGRASPEIHSSTPILHLDDDEERPITGLRNIISEKMVESKLIVPHFSFFDQADATHLVVLRESIRKEGEKFGFKVTFMPFLIKALSLAITKYPYFNGSVDLDENKLIIHKHHNIGIATLSPAGLVVCVIKNVQELSLYEVIKEYDALMKKAQAGKLEKSDMQESTFTISNFGPLGGLYATPIINYPEIAILGVAKIRKQVVVKDDAIAIRQMLNLSWSFDHRIIDGEGAAQFSNAFISLLEDPTQLLKDEG